MKRFVFNYDKYDTLEQRPISCEDVDTGEHLAFDYTLNEVVPEWVSNDPLVPSVGAEYELTLDWVERDNTEWVLADSEQWEELEQELKLKLE